MDRRAFLEGVAAAALAGACEGDAGHTRDAGPRDAGAPAGPPPDALVARLRAAVVPDDLEPAMSFRPLARATPRPPGTQR